MKPTRTPFVIGRNRINHDRAVAFKQLVRVLESDGRNTWEARILARKLLATPQSTEPFRKDSKS